VPLFSQPAVGLVHSSLEYIDETGGRLGTNLAEGRGRLLRELALLRPTALLTAGSTVVIRRECFETVGLFDVELSTSADWDMCRRIACHYEIEVVREPVVRYRLRVDGMHRNVGAQEHDMLRAFRKMFADPAARDVRPLRRRAYAKLYLILSGSYFEAGNRRRAALYALRATTSWPPSLAYIAAWPWRRLRRAIRSGTGEPRFVDVRRSSS